MPLSASKDTVNGFVLLMIFFLFFFNNFILLYFTLFYFNLFYFNLFYFNLYPRSFSFFPLISQPSTREYQLDRQTPIGMMRILLAASQSSA